MKRDKGGSTHPRMWSAAAAALDSSLSTVDCTGEVDKRHCHFIEKVVARFTLG
jgi:hypothetical protein